MQMKKINRCNLCGSQAFRSVYPARKNQNLEFVKNYFVTQDVTSQPNEIVRCTNCGLVYMLRPDGEGSLLKEYSNMKDELYLKEEGGRRKTARRVLKKILLVKKSGKMLDIGAANGFFLDEAKKSGWEVKGVEPSKWAADYAKRNFNIDIIPATLERANLESKDFDVIVALDVLEHLTDPKSALKKIYGVLKNDGVLCIATPDIKSLASKIFKNRWWGIKRHHIYYFSKKTLKRLLKEAGFNIISNGYYRRDFSIGYLLCLFETYNKRMANILKKVFKRLKTKKVAFNLYDEIVFYAKKDIR